MSRFASVARRVCAGAAALALSLAAAGTALAQEMPDTTEAAQAQSDDGLDLPARLSGTIEVGGELYGADGIDARRPGASSRLAIRPTLTLFGEFSVGLDILVSTEGSELRQNMSQFGINPRWGWGQLHLGDFSNSLSEYTMGNVRIRGGGLELTPGPLRFAVQGGRVQRAVSARGDDVTFQRNLVAARLGFGEEDGSYFDLHLLKADDDLDSVERELLVLDTTLADTIPEGLRPQVGTRPQENLVAGAAGQLDLFGGAFSVSGEAAAALITRDKLSPEVSLDSVGTAAALSGLQEFRLSTSGDFAYRVDAELGRGGWGLEGGYEYIGPGYVSLGLPYLINDRRAFNVGGRLTVLGNALSLQGRFRQQRNNLLDQKEHTTSRNIFSATASVRASQRVTANLTVTGNTIRNDAELASAALDNTSIAVATNAAITTDLFGKASAVTLGYTLSRTASGAEAVEIPTVTVHNVTTGVQMTLSPSLTVGPTVSTVVNRVGDRDPETNLFLGAQGRGRFLDGQLRTTLNLTHTQSSRRDMLRGLAQVSYQLPFGTDLNVQLRHTRYSAFGLQDGFNETFLTTTLRRSF